MKLRSRNLITLLEAQILRSKGSSPPARPPAHNWL